MKLHRIYGMILRHMYLLKRSIDQWTDMIYWPIIDLLQLGLIGVFVMGVSSTDTPILAILVSGVVFWLVVWRSQYEITTGLLNELWNKNLVNLFISPLTFWEWVMALHIMSLFKSALLFLIAIGVAFLIHHVNIFHYGFLLIPYFFLLLMNGWWVALFVCGLLFRFGSKLQSLGWSLVHLFAPLIGVYYPVAVLPNWVQMIAKFIPASYVFEGARTTLTGGVFQMNDFLIAFSLNTLYLLIVLLFLERSFKKTLEKGLIKVY